MPTTRRTALPERSGFRVGGKRRVRRVARGVAPVLLGALLLAGCGGGGGGGGPPPASTATPTKQPVPTTRGAFAVSGIERIPLHAIRAPQGEVARMYAIAEYGPPNDLHANQVRAVACRSYIVHGDCDDPRAAMPFTLHGTEEVGDAAQTRDLRRRIGPAARLVSVSIRPLGNDMVGSEGASLPFAVVQSAGNDEREAFFPPDEVARNSVIVRNVRAAVAADRVLYVGGYQMGENGAFERHPESTGCTGVDEGCLYAPYAFLVGTVSVSGTSYSTPNVASALASVLAVFPETKGADLIRLAKACARAEPGLSGLGRADFSCMTEMDENGEWRVVGVGAIVAPAAMNRLSFPGEARIGGSFTGGGGVPIALATVRPGLFAASGFSAGLPAGAPTAPGFFPVVLEGAGADAFGGGYATQGGFFAAAAYGRRRGFFGLGGAFGYDGAHALDADMGHRNVFLRLSRQWSAGRLVHAARGTALGLTARKRFRLAPAVALELSATADRFLGGSAETVFGPVSIAGSGWNEAASATLRITPGGGVFTLTGRADRRHASLQARWSRHVGPSP